MSSASNNKRSWTDSGVSVDKRQRLSGDDSEILELEESEALIEQVDGDDTKCRNGCIYLITNPINGKVYVGQTLHYKIRMKTHEYSGKNPKYYFGYAIRKYGWENFTKDILIDDVPEEDLDNLEINYIAFYESFGPGGYNLTEGGGGTSGYKYTEEHIEKITKNHDIKGGGCVSLCKTAKKWRVLGGRNNNGEQIIVGLYFTEARAKEALKRYNETGECLASDVTIRKSGTGSISEFFVGLKVRFGARYKGVWVGTYVSYEQAEQALNKYIQDGILIRSKRKQGTGSISKRQNGKFEATYKGKYVGTFASEEEAEQALKIHIVNLKK
jgi:group I intron endonuclease